jgi:hypothetical protein
MGPPRGVDPLSEVGRAQVWLDAALARHQSAIGGTDVDDGELAIVVGDGDPAAARDVRRALAALISERRGSKALATTIEVSVGDDGGAVLRPCGSGAQRLLGVVLREILVAQQAGTWRRLKICRNDRCAVAFYDRSPNASAVWHDAKRCGNAPNLRASRARRRGLDRSSSSD